MAVSASEIIEAVQIKISLTHSYTGDLGITLTSPAGTRSVLFTPYSFFFDTDDLSNFVLLTNAFYGESTNGNWTVGVVDGKSSDTGTLTSWSIRFFEH